MYLFVLSGFYRVKLFYFIQPTILSFSIISFFLFFRLITCPRCSSRHPTPLFPHFPITSPYFTQKPPPIMGHHSKTPHFYPPKPPKPPFSLKKPPKPPIFSDFPYFFIKNSGFYRHLTPAALIPYFSLFSLIFSKSSNSRLFPTFPQFLDQKPTKTLLFH